LYALGRHVLIELKDCKPEALNSIDFLKECLRDTAERTGATVVNDAFYQFTNYAAVDVFTCGNTIEPKNAVKILVEKFGAKESSYIELKRGMLQNDTVRIS
jgi:S-adenosylmethionine decarboxylase